ncbi:MAG: hypothetical protein EBU27_06090 [Opitutae bacterium]|nr:hypothetical protein [Opitutae bacterium]
MKEKGVRELLPHLTREQTEGCPQELHQRKEEPEEGGVPLMVLRSHRKKVVEENPLVEEGLHRVEQEAGEGARLTLQLLALQAEQEVEVVHSILPLLLTVHLRKKLETLHQKTGEGEDRAILARDHRIPLGILELPKLKVKEQEVLPSLRLPQLGEARLRMARRPGLNYAVIGFLIHGNRFATACRRGTDYFVPDGRGSVFGKCTNKGIDIFVIGSNFLVHHFMQLGKVVCFFVLCFTLGHFGFGSLLYFLKNFFRVLAKIYIKRYFGHDKWVIEGLLVETKASHIVWQDFFAPQ